MQVHAPVGCVVYAPPDLKKPWAESAKSCQRLLLRLRDQSCVWWTRVRGRHKHKRTGGQSEEAHPTLYRCGWLVCMVQFDGGPASSSSTCACEIAMHTTDARRIATRASNRAPHGKRAAPCTHQCQGDRAIHPPSRACLPPSRPRYSKARTPTPSGGETGCTAYRETPSASGSAASRHTTSPRQTCPCTSNSLRAPGKRVFGGACVAAVPSNAIMCGRGGCSVGAGGAAARENAMAAERSRMCCMRAHSCSIAGSSCPNRRPGRR